MGNKTKITLGSLQTCTAGLQKIFNADLPVKTSYWLSKTLDKMSKEGRKLEEEKNKLVKKWGEESKEEGKEGTFYIKKESAEDFSSELEELMNIEIDGFEFPAINIEILEKAGVKLSAVEVLNLVNNGFIEGD